MVMADATVVNAEMETEFIRLRGVRVHNLKGIDLDLPRDRLIVFTGLSGSGKSSLAFDTIHAEGRRRYIESLSSYARQFLDQMERPEIDLVEGLPPTVSIDQRTSSANPRSTVATVCEIHDYLRVLYARTGIPHCASCGTPIRRQTPEQMVANVLAMREGRKVLVLAPLVRARKGVHAEAFQAIRRAGLLRARVDGELIEIAKDDPKLAKAKVHSIEAVVDRLVVREGIRPRLAESIELALKLGEGTVLLAAQVDDGWEDIPLSIHYTCPRCGQSVEEIEPRTFSFNSPEGACQTCGGLGAIAVFDPELLFPNPNDSLDQALEPLWGEENGTLERPKWASVFLNANGIKVDQALESWPSAVKAEFLEGRGTERSPGLIPWLRDQLQALKSDRQRAELEVFRSRLICSACNGSRLRPAARGVTVGTASLPDLLGRSVIDVGRFLNALTWGPDQSPIATPLIQNVVSRLAFLEKVGLSYLTLDRSADTLSGGELQRARLASQIGSGLVGVCYVLDEPTAGLHPSDTELLLRTLRELRDESNTVIVVEHDEETIRGADWVVDLGPGAGALGGEVVAYGPPNALRVVGDSSTARYLEGIGGISAEASERLARSPGKIVVRKAAERNLKAIDVEIPLGTLTALSGVSGSGKSTLVHEVLGNALRRVLRLRGPRPGRCESIEGLGSFDKLINIDQAPIGRGPRSTPITYSGLFDEIRKLYAKTREAKIRGYNAPRFSFNVKGGRCEVCQGQGVRKVEMNFLPDLQVECETCRGLRFNRQTLEVKFKGHSIGEVLQLKVDDAQALFDAHPKILRGLEALSEAGLGYLSLGQSSTTLSGGEAQRVKLAAELGRVATGKTLFILDEPTTGLHFDDVARLLDVLRKLAERGNTLVVIEHHLDVLKSADWLIDLGPEGGDRGGELLAMGTPSDVARVQKSRTGQFLAR